MKKNTSLIVAALVSLLIAGCSKHTQGTTDAQKSFNWGVVDISDGTPISHDFGGGKVCTITPTILTNGDIGMECKIEESGKVVASPRMQTRPGVPVICKGGGMTIELTPRIKQ
jgi:hypothetical protein